MKAHVNQVFQAANGGIVQIDGIWLIDYANSRTLQIGDKLGGYKLKEIINGTDASYLGSLVFDYGVKITDLGTLGGSESYAGGSITMGR